MIVFRLDREEKHTHIFIVEVFVHVLQRLQTFSQILQVDLWVKDMHLVLAEEVTTVDVKSSNNKLKTYSKIYLLAKNNTETIIPCKSFSSG